MKKYLLPLLLFISSCSPLTILKPSSPTPMVYEGQYIVEARAGAEWCDGAAADPDVECQTEHEGKGYLVTPVGDGYSVIRKETIRITGKPRLVEYDRSEDLCFTDFRDLECEPHWHFSIDQQPDDPLYSRQWALPNIKAEEAWKTVSGSNVPVAVTDTGVDCSHPDINCIGEFNAITGEEGPGRAVDGNGHGTHVASTIGSYCRNGEGICGVGSGIPILACKFLADNGGGSLADAIKCLVWAREKGAKVVNASWGCQGCNSKSLLSTIQKSRDAGLLVFAAAAGNNGVNNDESPHFPSSYELSGYDPIISVAAISEDNRRAHFSNYGSQSVDVAAPGAGIMAAFPGGDYRALSGTSMATPHIAAASSLLLGMGAGDPRRAILQSARPLPDLVGRTVTNGTLDLLGALSGDSGQPPSSPAPCRKAKLKECRKDCAEAFPCRYGRQRRCRIECKDEWCPK